MIVRNDPRYLLGVEYFNRRAFFDAHEAWEELWAETEGPARQFLQGLIQVAVCLHHFGRGNVRGARKLYQTGTDYLRAYAPRQAGLDVDRFLLELESCCAELLARGDGLPRVRLEIERIPRLELG